MYTSIFKGYVRIQSSVLLKKEKANSLSSHLTRGAAGTFGLTVGATGISFIISVLLARLLGAAGYGAVGNQKRLGCRAAAH